MSKQGDILSLTNGILNGVGISGRPCVNPFFISHEEKILELAGPRTDSFRVEMAIKYGQKIPLLPELEGKKIVYTMMIDAGINDISELCMLHQEKYLRNNKSITSEIKDRLILMHPFFAFNSASLMNHQNSFVWDYAYGYSRRLIDTINVIKGMDSVDVIIAEDPVHYALLTSYLVEEGIVQAAPLTWFSLGHLRGDPGPYGQLLSDMQGSLYVGGAYLKECLSTFLFFFLRENTSKKEIVVVDDLTLPKLSDLKEVLERAEGDQIRMKYAVKGHNRAHIAEFLF